MRTPTGVVSSAGPEVIELAASAGLHLDPWECLVLTEALSERINGTWAASEVNLVVSRQNGKGSILEAVELADLFLLDTEMTIHSAHLFDTSKEAQTRLLTLIEASPDLDRFMSSHGGKVWQASGQEGIELRRDRKKRRLKFKTRTKGGGRGLTGDRVIIDEAMYYTPEQDAALRPTLSARPNPQLWMTASAGTKDSLQLGIARNRALEDKPSRQCYMEWSIVPHTQFCGSDCDRHDRSALPKDFEDLSLGEQGRIFDELVRSYARANPGLGYRLTVESIESERLAMSEETFMRERLGVGDWPIVGEASWRVISKRAWDNVADEESQIADGGAVCFAIDVTPERSMACIAVAGRREDGFDHVEIVDHRPGTTWVAQRIAELKKRHRPRAVIIGGFGAAASLIPDVEAAGIEVVKASTSERSAACGGFHDAVVRPRNAAPDWAPTLRHIAQPALTAAVAAAERQAVGREAWAWTRASASADISPLVTATLARWGCAKYGRKTTRPRAAWA
jgi:hypothetical protein